MSKNNKILITLFLVLLVALFIINRVTDPRAKRTTYFDVDQEHLYAFEFVTKTDTLRLVRDNSLWEISEPFRFPADNTRVGRFIEQIHTVETSRTPVSVSEESHKDYFVTDERGTVVRFYDVYDNLLDEAYVGTRGRMVYARRSDSDDVYQLSGNIGHLISANVNAWRDINTVSYPEEIIDRIDVEYRRNDYTLYKDNNQWFYEDEENNFSISPNNRALRNALHQLEEMPSMRFIDYEFEEYEHLLEDPELLLDITKIDGSTTNLVFGFDREQGDFVVMKDGNEDHLYLVEAETADNYTISYQHFQQ